MTPDRTTELYQQLILEHNKNPRNFKRLDDPKVSSEGYNPLCGDRYIVDVRVGTNGTIQAIGFSGAGCAISKASASIMTTQLVGKTPEAAKDLFGEFHQLLLGNGAPGLDLGKLKIFSGIWKFPSRVKCASLAWHTAMGAIDGIETVSTE